MVDVAEQILSVHAALEQLPSLEPGPVVDGLFSDLVSMCRYRSQEECDRVLADPRIRAAAARLRRIGARGEFLLERSWARRITGAEEPDAELASFPYLGNYEELTRLELHALAGAGLDLDQVRRVCFLGGGPLPLSALMIGSSLYAMVDVVDVSREAVALAAEVAQRVSMTGQIRFHHADAADFDSARHSDVVFMGALVGLDAQEKSRVLQALAGRMRPGSMIVIRSSHGLRTLLYPPVAMSDLRPFQPLLLVHPLTTVVNSVVVAVRT